MNVVVAAIADDAVLGRLIDLDYNLVWVRDRNKGVTFMMDFGQR